MAAPLLAWGEENVYRLADNGHLWGREFELLAAGTMLAAGSILHGLIGIEAEPIDEKCYEIRDGAKLIIYGMGNTETRELEIYQDDVLESFRLQQLQDAQS